MRFNTIFYHLVVAYFFGQPCIFFCKQLQAALCSYATVQCCTDRNALSFLQMASYI